MIHIRNFLFKLLSHKKDKGQENEVSNEIVLNTELSLAMEFGANWLCPIQKRLKEKYPNFTEAELNNI